MPAYRYVYDVKVAVVADGPNYQPAGEQEVGDWLRRQLDQVAPGGDLLRQAGESTVYIVEIERLRLAKRPTSATDRVESWREARRE